MNCGLAKKFLRVAILFLFAVTLLVLFCAILQPVRYVCLGEVSVSDAKKLIVYSASSLRAVTSEGAERCLELCKQNGTESLFYRLPDVYAGDKTHIKIWHYADDNLIRLSEQGLRDNSVQSVRECLLDLDNETLSAVFRDSNGVVYICLLSVGHKRIANISRKRRFRLFGEIYPDVLICSHTPINPIVDGVKCKITKERWTRNEGVLLGEIIDGAARR